MNSIYIKPAVFSPKYNYSYDFGFCIIITRVFEMINREITNKIRHTIEDNDIFLINILADMAKEELHLIE